MYRGKKKLFYKLGEIGLIIVRFLFYGNHCFIEENQLHCQVWLQDWQGLASLV
jgi:hypothetical protein